MAKNELQILVCVDLRPGVVVETLCEVLPSDRYDRKTLLLSEHGAPSLPATDTPHDIDWLAIGRAIEEVSEKVHKLQEGAKDKRTVVYIGGKGPLSAFIHLGYKFGQSIQRVEVLNQARGTGPWERYPIEATTTELETPRMFDPPRGVPNEISPSTARLAIYVDTAGRPDDITPFKDFVKANEKDVGGIVRLLAGEKLDVTTLNIDAITRDLKEFMSKVPSYWPDRRGIAMFAACPIQVAVAIGRSISATVQGGDVWLTEWRRPHYEFVYSLPFDPPMEPAVPKTAEAIQARRVVLDEVEAALADLRQYLEARHVPVGLLRESERQAFVDKVKGMKFETRAIEEQPFRIRVAEDRGCLGAGMLEAMRDMTAREQRDFAKLVVLHEIVHDWQDLTSTNHTFIGRAGFVLEEIDYFADAFAVQTLVNMELDLDRRAQNDVQGTLIRWINMVHRGIEAFDRMEQGPRMKYLAERRLRRYLLWYVQHARAKLVKTVEHAGQMLRSALTVELAPLAGYVDSKRHEKIVKHAIDGETELCVSVDGRLVRKKEMPGYSIPALVDYVREYKHEQASELMFALVDRNQPMLARWLKEP